MLKLLGTAAAAALLVCSAASFGQTSGPVPAPKPEASSHATENANAKAGTPAPRDWWTAMGLTAEDVGEAVRPWSTHPRLQDETSP